MPNLLPGKLASETRIAKILGLDNPREISGLLPSSFQCQSL